MHCDKPLFRTTRSLSVFLAVYLFVMLALVGLGGYRSGRPPVDFWPVYLYIVAVPLLGTLKTLTVLWELEKERPRPDRGMEHLYSVALLFPAVAGIIPVLLIMRYAGAS